ncbi:FAD-binding protein [Desulfosediminicola sp.]|uniref:FAD-binding protein n=1 Tax=Desulfosediminicola sp. TaxID=2886825 RepID=UPI003AF3146E
MNSTNEMSGLTRRTFMTLAGGAAGVAALSSFGIPTGWAANKPKVAPADVSLALDTTDVLVIGGGMAGLFAAVKAHDAGADVMILSKGRLGSSGQTPFAKGIFAYDPGVAGMTLDEFVDSVSRSALGSNNPLYTRQMAGNSLARVKELREWGFFESPLYNNCFKRPIAERSIPLLERVMVTHLLKENGMIAGAAGFSADDGKVHLVAAKSVILCTGAGGFKPNGFPICDLTHDGTVMAYNIGAKVTGKEWNDGHPASAENPAACFDGWGNMFEQKPTTTGVDIRHDLGVDMNYRAYVAGGPVRMGPPHQQETGQVAGGPYMPLEFMRNAPPGGAGGRHDDTPQRQGKGGPPPGMRGPRVGGSSAGMAIHKSEGLVPINDRCESTIPGLYAAGDALGSYMAGAIYTQIGSSLAGSAVQGAVAGEAAAAFCSSTVAPVIGKETIARVQEEMLAPLGREAGYNPAWVTQTLQGIMIPNFVLYIKKEKLLQAALAYVEELRDHHVGMLRAADFHELRLAHETANMIISAEMKLRASIMRTESRCSHFRLDYPEVDEKNWRAWINIYRGEDGSMKLEKQPFDSWPVA